MTDKQTVKFGDICKEVKLTTKAPIADGYERYIGLEHLDSGSLKIKRWGMIADDSPSFTRVFKKGQILFGKRRPYLRKAAIADFDGICSGDIIVMEATDYDFLSDILPYVIHSEKFWAWAVKTSSGSLSPRTKFSALKEFELSHSDVIKRIGVVTTLKKASELSQVNEKASLSLSRLRDVFSSDYLKKSGFVPLGRNRKNYVKLSSLVNKDWLKNGIYKPANSYGRGTYIVRIEDYQNGSSVVSSKLSKVDLSTSEIEQFGIASGDILINRVNSLSHLGKVTRIESLDEPMSFESNMMRLRVPSDNQLLSKFIYWFLTTPLAKKQVLAYAKLAIQQASISQGDVLDIRVPNFTPTEMFDFVSAMEQFDTVQSSVVDSVEQTKLVNLKLSNNYF